MTPQRKSHEFEGIGVEEAIQTAIKELGVSRETMNIKVVSEGQHGLFGMEGASPAKIKVIIKEKKS